VREDGRAAEEGVFGRGLTVVARLLVRHPNKVFFGYMAAAMWPVFYIRSEFNAAFYWAFTYLSGPILLLCVAVGWGRRRIFLAACDRPANYWIGLVLVPPLAVLFAGGLALQANALLPPQRDVPVEGIVTGKSITGAQTKSWIVDVRTGGEVRRFEVSPRVHAAARIGAPYREMRREGPLGFSYVWK
jgi:hypothetical protein